MTTPPEFDPQHFPSLALAYERVKESAQYQAGLFDALDSKLAMLWSVATGIIGVVVPLVISNNAPSNCAVWVALAVYLIATGCAGLGFFPRQFGSYGAPSELRELAKVPPERFYVDAITYIGKNVEHDIPKLDQKALSGIPHINWPVPKEGFAD